MNGAIMFRRGSADIAEITRHLKCCDEAFVPSLSARVGIGEYAAKLHALAERFEAWCGGALVGLVATYCNDPERKTAFVTSVSVESAWLGRGVARQLMGQCVEYARVQGFRRIELEVDAGNANAICLYEKIGFAAGRTDGRSVHMGLQLD